MQYIGSNSYLEKIYSIYDLENIYKSRLRRISVNKNPQYLILSLKMLVNTDNNISAKCESNIHQKIQSMYRSMVRLFGTPVGTTSGIKSKFAGIVIW